MNERYGRQLPLLGEEGQEKLARSKAGIAGCGGLGTAAVTALASAGIGELVLADPDIPEISNLNRQFVYREGSRSPKAELLARWAEEINPSCRATAFVGEADFDSSSVFSSCDIVLDCLDSIHARRGLNRWCVRNGKTVVHAGISGMQGQLTVVVPGKTPCIECLYGRVKEAAGPTPSLGAAVMHFGSAEALQAIMVLTGIGDPLVGRMLTADLSVPSYEVLDICRDPSCPVCGRSRRAEQRY